MARLIHLLWLTATLGFGTVNLVACDSGQKSAQKDRVDDDKSDQEGAESSVSA